MPATTTAVTLALLLLLAACGGAAEPASEPTSAPAEATATDAVAAEPSEPETATCDDGPTGTYRDTTWTDNVSDHVGFLYLKDWEDLSGLVNFEAGTLLAEDTLADLGLESDDTVKALGAVRHPSGFPNFSVFRLEGADASRLDIAEIYAREEASIAALPGVTEMMATEIEECLDSEPALGLEFTFTRDGDDYYQVSFFTQHEGAIYHLQWLDERKGIVELLDEMLGSWHWASGGGGFGTGSDDAADTGAEILQAHVGSVIPEGDADPDPAAATTEFAADVPRICVFSHVKVDAADTVLITW
ncbi:MAG TPA: hypothetical protein VMM81_02055, partial [Acidimicrobiia bacterium]|nr:hypothetical protein [Acidimicrobiia bacterium]